MSCRRWYESATGVSPRCCLVFRSLTRLVLQASLGLGVFRAVFFFGRRAGALERRFELLGSLQLRARPPISSQQPSWRFSPHFSRSLRSSLLLSPSLRRHWPVETIGNSLVLELVSEGHPWLRGSTGGNCYASSAKEV